MYQEMQAEMGPLLEYFQREPEIEAAYQALETHRPAFDRFAKDEVAYVERGRSLFAEERFAPLRFTADDVRQAFDQVGTLSNLETKDQTVQKLRAAILHLADKQRREHLGMKLTLLLPELVAEGRLIEAGILHECAAATTDVPDESNLFLFEMFSAGYAAWVTIKRHRERAWMREVGIEPEVRRP